MDQDQELRKQLINLMKGGQAFTPSDEILNGITLENAGKTVDNLPYTLWQLMEHLRIALLDILEFSRNPTYQSPQWPEGYWPEEKSPKDYATLERGKDGKMDWPEFFVGI